MIHQFVFLLLASVALTTHRAVSSPRSATSAAFQVKVIQINIPIQRKSACYLISLISSFKFNSSCHLSELQFHFDSLQLLSFFAHFVTTFCPCFSALWVVAIRFQQVRDFGDHGKANIASIVLGFTSSISISVTGNFQVALLSCELVKD